MVKKTVILIITLLLMVAFFSPCLAKEKEKAMKAKGQLIYNEDKGYVKVLDKNYKVTTIYLDKKTSFEAVIKAKQEDLANEKDGRGRRNLPEGAVVTYTMKDGKPVATKVSYKSSARWGIKKK